MSNKVKIGVVGVGGMGSSHVRDCRSIDNIELAGVCDIIKEIADKSAEENNAKAYYDVIDMLDNSGVEGIIIATPHYAHTSISIEAFKRGIHVLTEKPVGVHVNDIQKMIKAYEEAKKKKDNLVFSAMFQQGSYGYWKKIKEMIDNGELGKLIRTTWIITDWFRTQYYYDSGDWRATWEGEGGGVLLNQCPHNLDLYQWFVGLPDKVSGFAAIGKYHNIEVEDEVTAYFEYKNGMVGHFITTTAESPGSNCLEIIGENGKLIFENGKLVFYKNEISMFKQIKEAQAGFEMVKCEKIEVPFTHHGEPGHRLIIQNFANAILDGEELIADAREGLNSVMISNAIMLSSFMNKTVDIPIDGDAFEKKLGELIKNSKFKKKAGGSDKLDMEKSFKGISNNLEG